SAGQSEHGLQRLQWNGVDPFDVLDVTATPLGFRVRFTQPVAAASAIAASFAVRSWTYDHHEDYGCPPRDEHPVAVTEVLVAADGATVELVLGDVATCRVYEVKCAGVRAADGDRAPWH